MVKNFVICRTCEENGLFKPLGEVDPDGNFWIKRRLDYTIIVGDSFSVSCSACGQSAYIKERRSNEGTLSYHWEQWVSGVSISPGTITPGS